MQCHPMGLYLVYFLVLFSILAHGCTALHAPLQVSITLVAAPSFPPALLDSWAQYKTQQSPSPRGSCEDLHLLGLHLLGSLLDGVWQHQLPPNLRTSFYFLYCYLFSLSSSLEYLFMYVFNQFYVLVFLLTGKNYLN